jgi:hypothetical protein
VVECYSPAIHSQAVACARDEAMAAEGPEAKAPSDKGWLPGRTDLTATDHRLERR